MVVVRGWSIAVLILAAGCTQPNRLAKLDKGGNSGLDKGGNPGLDGGANLESGGPIPDGAVSDDVGAAGGRINIYVKGDQTKPTFKDGLSGQTPTNYEIALSRYQVMTSALDPKPVLCFDHGSKPVVTNMAKDTLVGYCKTQSIKTGAYTHGRTKVDWARYTVNGVYHLGTQKLPGKFTFFRAYSDVTYKGTAYKAGKGFISFSGLTTVQIPFTYGPMPPMPGVQFKTIKGEFFMTFRYSKPLPIVQPNKGSHWARFHWKVGDAFRWKELTWPSYSKGSWDVSPVFTSIEPVLVHGVWGYRVTSSVD